MREEMNDEILIAKEKDGYNLTFEELQFLREYEREQTWDEAKKIAQSGQWTKFVEYVEMHHEIMELAVARYYKDIPDDLKFDFLIDCYVKDGDSVPQVRQLIRGARKYRYSPLPDELERQSKIVVYRAGEESIDKAKYRLSWTIDKQVALYFRYLYNNGEHAQHLYKGEISPDKVIAYTDDRSEKEIIQYRNVQNIVEFFEAVDVEELKRKYSEENWQMIEKYISEFNT